MIQTLRSKAKKKLRLASLALAPGGARGSRFKVQRSRFPDSSKTAADYEPEPLNLEP
jgi:hypothetical protein